MKRIQRPWFIGICAIACLVCVIGGPQSKHVLAQTQTFDDGLFTIFMSIDSDSNNYIYVSDYLIADGGPDEEYDVINGPEWNLSDGESGGGDSLTFGPVAPGNTYTATVNYAVEYAYDYTDDPDGEGECYAGQCSGFDALSGYASIDVPPQQATVTGISPSDWTAGQSYTGATGTAVQITGTNFGSTPSITLSDPAIQITRQAYNTSTSGSTSTTSIDIYVPSETPSEPVTVTVAPGANGNSFAPTGSGTLSGSSTANVIGAQQNSCPQGIDANSGFSSITPTGLAPGGSGSIAVSFSHGSYNGFGVTVPYGPNSTPESIASHLAALITKQYASSGLVAQADGANILYKSNATLGNANFTSSGSGSDSSFTADPSPAACPSVNLTYILAVTTDSVDWILIPGSSGQQGRSLTYVLIKKPTADIPISSFQHPPVPYTDTISEHFTKPGWMASSNSNTGEFDDVLGTASVCPQCITGTDTNYRYFTGILNNQNLGTLQIYDQTGLHTKDYIQITHPSGPSILNHWTNPNGKPKDISLQDPH